MSEKVENRIDPKEWLKLLRVIPIVFIAVAFFGILSGTFEVLAHDYFEYGLTNLALKTLTAKMNTLLLVSLRLLLPTMFVLVIFFLFYHKFSNAFRATLGAGFLWGAVLFGIYLFLQKQIVGIDMHNLPDLIRKTLTLDGFFKRYLVEEVEFTKMLLLPFREPFKVIAALTLALPFGFFFEKATRFGRFQKRDSSIGRIGRLVMWSGFALSILLFSAINTAAFALAGKTDIPQPNVILISIDTLRQDGVGAYGSTTSTTPAINAVAEGGAIFENAYSHSPWTLPSHAALFTGLTPTHLGIRKVEDRLGKKALLLSEVLNNYGYSTGAVTSYVLVSQAYGFSQGFDDFNYSRDYNADMIVSLASKYINSHKKKKFFLFLHFYDPHWPYHPKLDIAKKFYTGSPTRELAQFHNTMDYYDWAVKALKGPEEFVKFSKSMYEAEINYVDQALGRLFSNLVNAGMINRTVILITSDHGEEFKEHGLMGHGLTLYDEVLKVPFIVRYPAQIPKNTSIDMRVQLTDLFPTILSMLGIENPVKFLDAKDLTSELIINESTTQHSFIAETAMSGEPRFAVIEENTKYITPFELHFGESITLSHPTEVYDLESDAAETQNLAESQPTLTSHLKKELSDKLENIEKNRNEHGSMSAGESRALSAEEIERLRSLGYIQ